MQYELLRYCNSMEEVVQFFENALATGMRCLQSTNRFNKTKEVKQIGLKKKLNVVSVTAMSMNFKVVIYHPLIVLT